MPILNPPSGLQYTTNSIGSVILSWFPISGATSYNVYRRTDPLAQLGLPINQSPVTAITFTDNSPNTVLVNYYNVTAVNSSGESQPSSALTVDLTITSGGITPVYLDQGAFDTFIKQHAYTMLWERAQVCPCSLAGKSTQDASDLDHPLCKNKQFIWTSAGEIPVLITRIQRGSGLTPDGNWEQGIFFVSSQSGVKPGFYDRLTFTQTAVPFSEAIKKGALNGTDAVRFPAISVVLPIIDFNGNTYQYGVDFGLTPAGDIVWGGFSGKQPQTDLAYSVVYLCSIRALVVDYPHVIRGQNTQINQTVPTYKDFPVQTIMKLEFFFNI